MDNYEYRVEYKVTEDWWSSVDSLTFDTEGAAEAHLNYFTCHAYSPNYRIVRRLMPAWEAVES